MTEYADTPSPMFKLDQAFLEDFNDLIDDSLGEFELLPGWASVAWRAGIGVQVANKLSPATPAFKLVQLSEKLGTLRIRFSGYTTQLLQLAEAIEYESTMLCMYCGQSGRLELGIEALTACPVCRALRLDPAPEAATELRQRMDDQIIRFLNHRADLAAIRNNADD